MLASGAAAAYWYVIKPGGPREDLLTHQVKKEKLRVTVVERGTLESAVNRDVTCRVKAKTQGSTVATTIKWVIDDGSVVKQGQLLAELDSSALQDALKQQKIDLDKAEADKITAEEQYNIVISQNISDIKTAETNLTLAEIDLKKYLEGDYLQTKKDIEGRLAIAKSDLEMWEERSAWSARMSKRNYVTASQAQADSSRLQSAKIALQKVEEELRVLEDPGYGMKKRTTTDLQSKIDEAKRTLDRVKKQAIAKEAQADADRKAKLSVYAQQQSKYGEIEDEIRKCIVTSPQDGLVVYYVPEQARFGMGQQQSVVAQGEPVREGQKMMQIPDLSKMLVNAKVHEAMVARVKGERWKRTGFSDGVSAALVSADPMSTLLGHFAFNQTRQDFSDKYKDQEQELLYGGQPAKVRIDAFTDVGIMKGHIKSVATVASQQDWLSSDVKVYQTMIAIDETHDGLKPGMSAEVTIFIDNRTDDVVAVPIQSIIGSAATGKQRQVYVIHPDGTPELRDVTVGSSNEKMVEVEQGLQEGETVVLNPRVLLNEKQKGKVRIAPNQSADKGEDAPVGGSEKDEKGKGKDKGKGKGKGKAKAGPGGEGGGPAGPGGGPSGPGGGPGAGRGGPGGPGGGSYQDMTPEQRKQMQQQMIQRFRQASPDERKQMIEATPEAFRDRVKQMLKQNGIDVPN